MCKEQTLLKNPILIHFRGRRKPKPGFINGELTRRGRGVTKVLVYHFDDGGNLLVDLMHIKYLQPAVFQLEG